MRMKLRSGAATVLVVGLLAGMAGNVSADHVDEEARSLLREIIRCAEQGKEDGLLKGFERTNIARAAKHALRDLDAYERRTHQGREAAARQRLESYYRNLDAIDVALDDILARRLGREALVEKIKALLDEVREQSPPLDEEDLQPMTFPVRSGVPFSVPEGYKSLTVEITDLQGNPGWAIGVSFDGSAPFVEQHRFDASLLMANVPVIADRYILLRGGANEFDATVTLHPEQESRVLLLGKLVNYPFTSPAFSTDGFGTLAISVGAGDNPQHITGVSVQREEDGAFVGKVHIPCDGGAQCELRTVPVLGGNYRIVLEGNGTGAVLAGILRPSPCSAPMSDTQPIVEDNFNGYANGSIVGQGGWESYVNGDHFVVQGATVFEGSKALQNNSLGDSVVGKAGTPRADGRQTVCVRTENRANWGLYADGNVGVRISKGLNASGAPGLSFAPVSFKSDGHVAYYDPVSDVYSNFATYNDNEWTLLEIEWRSSDRTARYRVNSGVWTDWKPFANSGSFTNFDYVNFGFILPSGSGGVYFDTLQ